MDIPAGQNPYNLPTPQPGVIAPISMESFDIMIESEECDLQDMASTPSATEEANEGNYRTATND